jgi:hypothetical protein
MSTPSDQGVAISREKSDMSHGSCFLHAVVQFQESTILEDEEISTEALCPPQQASAEQKKPEITSREPVDQPRGCQTQLTIQSLSMLRNQSRKTNSWVGSACW